MSITDALKTDIAHIGDFVPTSSGDLDILSGLANLRRALFHRLITVPGSLVHRPTYGVGVGLYQNAPNTFAMQQKLATLIREQFLQDPRVQDVTSVAITSKDNTPQTVVITVFVKVVGYNEQEMRFTPFNEANT